MIYLDSSVALAHLLAEDRRPAASLWDENLVSSRLLEYEIWNRIHSRQLSKTQSEPVRRLVGRIFLIELDRRILARAVEAFSVPVRTLDALHLATAAFMQNQDRSLRLATFDQRMQAGAQAMGIPLYDL